MHARQLKASGVVGELGMPRWLKEEGLFIGVAGVGPSSQVASLFLNLTGSG